MSSNEPYFFCIAAGGAAAGRPARRGQPVGHVPGAGWSNAGPGRCVLCRKRERGRGKESERGAGAGSVLMKVVKNELAPALARAGEGAQRSTRAAGSGGLSGREL